MSGLVIVGASGALASESLKLLSNTHKEIVLFDKVADLQRNILPCNLLSVEDVRAALAAIPIERYATWRVLLCSGLYRGVDHPSLEWAELQASLAANLLGPVQFVTGFASRAMANSAKVRIVVVTSAAARVGSRDISYGIAKAGLEGMVRSMSKSYARLGITIVGVAPGVFPSPMSLRQSPDRHQRAVEGSHLGRSCELAEVAKCVEFAAVEAPDALTGTFISPNGGQI